MIIITIIAIPTTAVTIRFVYHWKIHLHNRSLTYYQLLTENVELITKLPHGVLF